MGEKELIGDRVMRGIVRQFVFKVFGFVARLVGCGDSGSFPLVGQ